MPRRTNAFQDLVTLIELQLAPRGACISPSALIGDPPREIDILIRVPAGDHEVLIGVECIDHKRPASVEWVEQILAKHRGLAIHKSVLVSRKGFSKAAEKMARRAGADILNFRQAMHKEWKAVDRIDRVDLTLLVRDRIEGVLVEFKCEQYPSHINFDEAVYYVDGKPIEPLRNIVSKLQQHPNADRELFLAARETGEGYINLVWIFEDGEYLLDEKGVQYPMAMVVEFLHGRLEHERLPTESAMYADKLVTFSFAQHGDAKLRMVAVQKAGGHFSVASLANEKMTQLGHTIDGVLNLVPAWSHEDDTRYLRMYEEFWKKKRGEDG